MKFPTSEKPCLPGRKRGFSLVGNFAEKEGFEPPEV